MNKTEYEEVKEIIEIYIKSVKELDFPLMRSAAQSDGRIFLGNTSTSKNLHDH